MNSVKETEKSNEMLQKTEVVAQKCCVRKVFFEISQN